MQYKLSDCKLIELPFINDTKGNLTFIENQNHIPFEIKRIFYLYDVPGGAERAGHANIKNYQLLIAISGSFDVILDNGENKEKYSLNRSYKGLLITPMIWRTINNFSSGSVCLVLASELFSENDYYRDYKKYLDVINEKR